MQKFFLYIALPLLLTTSVNELYAMQESHDVDIIKKNLAFECHRETDVLPPINQDAELLYNYGLFIEKKEGPKNFDDAARYYRIAAAHGHYKASTNLQALVSQGLANSPNAQSETIELVERLMAQNVPGAYYDMGHYLEIGYGVEQSNEKANAYFRKAADLGNPDAQFYVANLLSRVTGGHEVMTQMRRCAAYQGHARAAQELGTFLRVGAKYNEAVEAYQQGVKAGDSASARKLSKAFEGPTSTDDLYYMNLKADDERSSRYSIIEKFLIENEEFNPKIPDIDTIVPLPPAKLPSWDGKFQWQIERDAKAIPDKPKDALLQRLSNEKNLDPSTGLPL
ncbi:SEL1-like repeat protein [Pseudomonas fragariae (ex Marin et al. 2024)]|uniref:SEL1-like repeat protein n=1 Tax=Pseudomonas fragariae (ex Marin et al. 2024) TaxID=3080056 RepID=UPI003F79AF77